MKSSSKNRAPQRPMDKVLSKLTSVKKQGDGYIARCPAHADKNPSLSISEGRDGRVLLYCHAGCTLTAILHAINMKTSDLYPADKSKIVEVYQYMDEHGDVVYEIVRTEPKNFRARHQVDGHYVNNIKGITLKPYRLPELIQAVDEEKTFIIVEGEKDCDNVVEHLKVTATTFPFGMKWVDDYGHYFKDAKVVIIPDNDKPGYEKAKTVAHKLKPLVKSIRIVTLPDLPDKGDISDWIENGGTRGELVSLIKATPIWEPSPEVEESEIELAIKAKTDEFNELYFTVLHRGKYVVIQPNCYDPSLELFSIDFIPPAQLQQKFAHDKLVVGHKGKSPIMENSVKVWLGRADRRDYEGIVFDPGVDHGAKYFNIFQGFAVQPIKAKIDLYLNHIFEVIANGDVKVYDHLIAIMADAVQLRPRPGVAVAVKGLQGVGKGIFINNFGLLFGRHFLHITQGSHLTGRFNRHLIESMIVFVDEALWAGDKKAEGVLKGLVTEETMMIEAKNFDAYPVKNHNRLFMASNSDWMVPAGLEERRFFVVDASDKYIQDRAYFGRIQKQMDNGGREGLLHYLQQYDLDGIDLTAFPRTEALASQKLLSMDPVEQFWYSVLQNGKLFSNVGDFDNNVILTKRAWKSGVIESELLYLAFTDSIKNQPTKWYTGSEGFGITLKKLVPTRKKKMIKGAMRYVFPSLQECRDLFDKRTNQKWDWPENAMDD